MRTTLWLAVAAFGVTALPSALGAQAAANLVRLPAPRREGAMSLEAALWARHSTRAFTRDSIALADAGQLLWAAQGVNRPDGHRTAPSAGATYPLELYLVAARVRELPSGVYRYRPAEHALEPVASGDRLGDLVGTVSRQQWIGDAAAVVVLTAAYQRTAGRYGERATAFVPIEAGHAAGNLALQCAALGLGTTYVGSISDTTVARVLTLAPDVRALGLLPIGRPR